MDQKTDDTQRNISSKNTIRTKCRFCNDTGFLINGDNCGCPEGLSIEQSYEDFPEKE